MIEYRPASGGGSCARCLAALGLDAVKQEGRWFCCAPCAEGRPPERGAAVSETRLYNRPQRYFHKRFPKELRGAL